ncbi:MAG TPA: GAF domain-containing sensor histidine kinase [Candidatus Limnocylindria bacterium]|nr:GAF domain-containing sensor histidine kinase [Candidatus Limnocylindria bacterium]
MTKVVHAARSIPIARRAASTWLAWSCGAVGAALVFVRYALEAGTVAPDAFGAVSVLLPLAFPALGALLASRRPEHPIGWLFLAMAIGWGVADVAGAYRESLPQDHTLASLAAWLHGWPNYVGIGALLFIVLLFPDGRPPSHRWRAVAWLIAGYTAASVLLVAIEPATATVLQPLFLPLLVTAAISLVLRLIRATGVERQQLTWLVAAGLVVIVMVLVTFALETLAPPSLAGLGKLSRLALYASVCLVPISVAVAILRYRLYDLDLLVNRTLVYSTLTLGVLAFYVAVVGYLGSLFRAGDDLILSLVATGLIAVLFQPLRERVQRSVDRLLYGRRHEPYAVLSELGQRLGATLASDALIEAIVGTVRESLKLSYTAVALRIGDETTVAAASGVPRDEPLQIPLKHQNEVVGALLVSARRGEELTSADQRLLDDLARQAGVVVHAVRLTTELRQANAHLLAAREELVSAREEERRRLRRDLHDGLGPRLASLTLRLEAARDGLAREPEAAALLGDLAERTRDAIAEIRRLVTNLRPAALDELGLVPALREAAAEYEHAGRLRITVEGSDLLALPAAVEVAAYRIAVEAMTNVVRHASARRCVIRLAVDGSGDLQIDVADDGGGIPAHPRGGVGLPSMHERAAELGGNCSIERSPAGGTRVRAVIPLKRGDLGERAERASAPATFRT